MRPDRWRSKNFPPVFCPVVAWCTTHSSSPKFLLPPRPSNKKKIHGPPPAVTDIWLLSLSLVFLQFLPSLPIKVGIGKGSNFYYIWKDALTICLAIPTIGQETERFLLSILVGDPYPEGDMVWRYILGKISLGTSLDQIIRFLTVKRVCDVW